jgi:hypothetical protein
LEYIEVVPADDQITPCERQDQRHDFVKGEPFAPAAHGVHGDKKRRKILQQHCSHHIHFAYGEKIRELHARHEDSDHAHEPHIRAADNQQVSPKETKKSSQEKGREGHPHLHEGGGRNAPLKHALGSGAGSGPAQRCQRHTKISDSLRSQVDLQRGSGPARRSPGRSNCLANLVFSIPNNDFVSDNERRERTPVRQSLYFVQYLVPLCFRKQIDVGKFVFDAALAEQSLT